ncbi:MAG: bacterial/archaeal transporter family protein [Patescibacteria group bacterium]|jgi:transporter family protein|nr:bacterial/archaeal transporter family protein [Patescibacteria group bacterium]
MGWIILSVLSAFFASLVAILGKFGLKNIDPTLATTIRALVMAGFFVITSIALGKFHSIDQIQGRTFWIIVGAGIAGALSWLCYFWALKSGPATAVSAIDRGSIVFVVILALVFLGEALTWKTIVGSLLVVLGTLFFVL